MKNNMEIYEMSNDFKEVLDAYNQTIQELNKVINENSKKLSASMKKFFNEFLSNNEQIEYVAWTQYTPHFNDGDECIFSVHDMYFKLKNDDFECHSPYDLDGRYEKLKQYWYDIAEGKTHEYSRYYTQKQAKAHVEEYEEMMSNLNLTEDEIDKINYNFEEFKKVISQIDEDIFKVAFGDHAIVRAYKDKFDVDEYEHD